MCLLSNSQEMESHKATLFSNITQGLKPIAMDIPATFCRSQIKYLPFDIKTTDQNTIS